MYQIRDSKTHDILISRVTHYPTARTLAQKLNGYVYKPYIQKYTEEYSNTQLLVHATVALLQSLFSN